MNKWIKSAFKTLREEFGNKCFNCHRVRGLEFAHTAPTALNGRGRGRKERYYDIIQNRDKYVLACRICHHDLDAGLITIET